MKYILEIMILVLFAIRPFPLYAQEIHSITSSPTDYTVILTKGSSSTTHTMTVRTMDEHALYYLDDSFDDTWKPLEKTGKISSSIKQYMMYGYDYPSHQTVDWYLATQQRLWEVQGYQVEYRIGEKVYDVTEMLERLDACIQPMKKAPLPTSIKVRIYEPYSVTIPQNAKDRIIITTHSSFYDIQRNDTLTLTSSQKRDGSILYHYGVDESFVTLQAYEHGLSISSMDYLDDVMGVETIGMGDFQLKLQDSLTEIAVGFTSIDISSTDTFKKFSTYTSDEKGNLAVHLEEGAYFYRFRAVPSTYHTDQDVYTFTIQNEEPTKLTHSLNPVLYTIKMESTFEDEQTHPITLTIQEKTLGKYSMVVEMNESTQEVLLPEGTYTIHASHVKNMDTPKAQTVVITDTNEPITFTYLYHRIKVNVEGIDALTEKRLKEQVSYAIYNMEGQLQDGKKGLICGQYVALPTTTPTGYQSSNQPLGFEVAEKDEKLLIQYPHMMLLGKITYHVKGDIPQIKDEKITWKRGSLANTTIELRARKDIVGKEGTLFYQKGQVISTKTTNKKGVVTFDNLPLGEYEVEEVSMGQGYALAPSEAVSVKTSKLNSSRSIYHEHAQTTINIHFSWEESSFPRAQKAVWQLVSDEDIYENDMLIYPKGTCVEEIEADSTIQLQFAGKYRLVEVSSDEAYEYHDDICFTYRYGKDLKDVNIAYELTRKSITIDVLDVSAHEGISSVVLHVTNSYDEFYDVTTLADGSFTLTGMELGEYQINEMVLDDSFEPIEVPIQLEVTADDDANTLTLYASKKKIVTTPNTNHPFAWTIGGFGVLTCMWFARLRWKHA